VVNWDGSVISRTGLVEVLTKGDSCLMSWQMVRKPEPVFGSEKEQKEVTTAPVAPVSRKMVGGVALDLPF